MDKIKKYIEKFLKEKEMNKRFSISLKDLFLIKGAAKHNAMDAIVTTFDYGYAKSYRAAMSEVKKGGK